MTSTTIGAPSHVLTDWKPEDEAYWERKGKRVANRNLAISVPALLLAFAVWTVWSVLVVNLPGIGFKFDTEQLFWLTALPGLSGATLRILYSFVVPIFGGRLWTALSTASLLLPAIGIGFAVQDAGTPYYVFLILALMCGFGGGNFASSMSNISFFFPKRQQGYALGINAGLGNLGVSVAQFVVPLVVTFDLFAGALGGSQRLVKAGVASQVWIQNAGFFWVPFVLAATLAAWFGMNDISSARASFREQAVIFKRKHNWIMCWLYLGTFGSFIGYSAGFPLLARVEFPQVDSIQYVFLGPLIGAVTRALAGPVSDRLGGGRVTLGVFVAMILAVLGVLYFLGIRQEPGAFWGFFAMFMLLFAAAGVGNASTFQMIPIIFRKLRERALGPRGASEEEIRREASRESAAVIAFSSAVAAFGGFFIPRSYGESIEETGGPEAALWVFVAFYVVCVVLTLWYYVRRNAEVRC